MTLKDIKLFLSDAPAEPLEWEAKEKWEAGSIRKAVCGFANSHDGGYLLLGASKSEGGPWTLGGVRTPNADAPSDVTDILQDRGVTPYPVGLNVHAFDVPDDRQLVVVFIPPVSTPPCVTHGTVYERLSGKTVPVRDAARLAELFERGDAARQAAASKAERLVGRAMELVPFGLHAQEITLALGAPGLPLDLTPMLFSPDFNEFAYQLIEALLIDEPSPHLRPRIDPSMTQFELIYAVSGADSRLGWDWFVCISRDGAAFVNWKPKHSAASVRALVSGDGSPVARAWRYSAAMLERLGLGKSSSLAMRARLPEPSTLDAFVARDGSTGPTEAALRSIEQELLRADGEFVFADPLDPGAT